VSTPTADWLTELNHLQDAAQGAFSQPITFRPASGPVTAMRGIFQAEHKEVAFDGGEEVVSSVGPVLEVKLASLPQPVIQGDEFDIAGTTYQVTDVQEDGLGSAKLLLVVT